MRFFFSLSSQRLFCFCSFFSFLSRCLLLVHFCFSFKANPISYKIVYSIHWLWNSRMVNMWDWLKWQRKKSILQLFDTDLFIALILAFYVDVFLYHTQISFPFRSIHNCIDRWINWMVYIFFVENIQIKSWHTNSATSARFHRCKQSQSNAE